MLLNPEIFTRPGLYPRIFERLGDSQAGEAIARAVQSPASFREPWMHKLVDLEAKPVVVVYPRYAPSLNGNWMSSVVLRHAPPFTHEKTMVDEWMCNNCRTDQNGDWHAATHNLLGNLSLQRWVLEELSFWPIGVRTMFRIIERVYEQLHGMGTYNMTSWLAFTDAELDEKHTLKYEALLQSAYEQHMEMLRHLFPWQQAADQEAASWQEQHDGMQLLLDRFDRLLYFMEQIVAADDIAAEGLPHICPLYIEGPPGCGKTFIALQFVRNLFERGITSNQVEITCVSAYRASVLGGVHIHELFGFLPGNSNLWATPQSLAAVALRRLRKNPEKMRRLQELIVLVVDEFGQCGAELLVAMDNVLRKVRGTEHPFGGLLLVAAGDHYQTEPIRMRPPLTSYIFRCNFEVISLRRLFRSRGDQGLQRIINLMRVPEMSAEGIEEVLHLIEDAFLGCNQVVSPDEVHSDAVWLLSKRKAVSDARDDAFEVARPDDPDVPMDRFKRKYMAEDQHLQAGNWRPASNDRLVTPLDRTCALVKKCYAIVGKRVTVTQNFRWDDRGIDRLVANGMAGMVTHFNDITVRVELDNGWHVPVHRVYSPVVHCGGKQLRRRQFPLELAVASSIHDAQGMTLPHLATHLDADSRHAMWSRMMAFTLFTRAERLRGIWLVNYDRNEMLRVLQHRTAWHGEVDVWLRQNDLLRAPLPRDIEIPQDYAFTLRDTVPMHPPGITVVYVVKSLRTDAMYVGFTNNMRYRLHVHNSAGCARTSGASDWHYIFVVTGFEAGWTGLRQARKFEGRVQHSHAHRHDLSDLGLLLRHLIDEVRVQTGWNLYMEVFNVAPRHSSST